MSRYTGNLANREPIYSGMRVTTAQYERFADDGYLYEIINGIVVPLPQPDARHQEIVGETSRQLRNFLRDAPAGKVVSHIDVRFDDLHLYNPDLIFISKARLPRRTPRIHVVPEMVLEVLSPGTKRRDLGTKKADYERFGVHEYWIIDPAAKHPFTCLRRKHDTLFETKVPARSFRSQAVPGFVLDLAAVGRVILDQ